VTTSGPLSELPAEPAQSQVTPVRELLARAVVLAVVTVGLFAAIVVGLVLQSGFDNHSMFCDPTLRLSCSYAEQPTEYTTGYWLTFLCMLPFIVGIVLTSVFFAQWREAVRRGR